MSTKNFRSILINVDEEFSDSESEATKPKGSTSVHSDSVSSGNDAERQRVRPVPAGEALVAGRSTNDKEKQILLMKRLIEEKQRQMEILRAAASASNSARSSGLRSLDAQASKKRSSRASPGLPEDQAPPSLTLPPGKRQRPSPSPVSALLEENHFSTCSPPRSDNEFVMLRKIPDTDYNDNSVQPPLTSNFPDTKISTEALPPPHSSPVYKGINDVESVLAIETSLKLSKVVLETVEKESPDTIEDLGADGDKQFSNAPESMILVNGSTSRDMVTSMERPSPIPHPEPDEDMGGTAFTLCVNLQESAKVDLPESSNINSFESSKDRRSENNLGEDIPHSLSTVDVEDDLSTAGTDLVLLKTKEKNLLVQMRHARSSVRSSSSDLFVLKANHETIRTRRTELEARQSALLAQLRLLEAQLVSCCSDDDKHVADIDRVDKQLRDAQKVLAKREAALEQLRQRIKQLESEPVPVPTIPQSESAPSSSSPVQTDSVASKADSAVVNVEKVAADDEHEEGEVIEIPDSDEELKKKEQQLSVRSREFSRADSKKGGSSKRAASANMSTKTSGAKTERMRRGSYSSQPDNPYSHPYSSSGRHAKTAVPLLPLKLPSTRGEQDLVKLLPSSRSALSPPPPPLSPPPAPPPLPPAISSKHLCVQCKRNQSRLTCTNRMCKSCCLLVSQHHPPCLGHRHSDADSKHNSGDKSLIGPPPMATTNSTSLPRTHPMQSPSILHPPTFMHSVDTSLPSILPLPQPMHLMSWNYSGIGPPPPTLRQHTLGNSLPFLPPLSSGQIPPAVSRDPFTTTTSSSILDSNARLLSHFQTLPSPTHAIPSPRQYTSSTGPPPHPSAFHSLFNPPNHPVPLNATHASNSYTYASVLESDDMVIDETEVPVSSVSSEVRENKLQADRKIAELRAAVARSMLLRRTEASSTAPTSTSIATTPTSPQSYPTGMQVPGTSDQQPSAPPAPFKSSLDGILEKTSRPASLSPPPPTNTSLPESLRFLNSSSPPFVGPSMASSLSALPSSSVQKSNGLLYSSAVTSLSVRSDTAPTLAGPHTNMPSSSTTAASHPSPARSLPQISPSIASASLPSSYQQPWIRHSAPVPPSSTSPNMPPHVTVSASSLQSSLQPELHFTSSMALSPPSASFGQRQIKSSTAGFSPPSVSIMSPPSSVQPESHRSSSMTASPSPASSQPPPQTNRPSYSPSPPPTSASSPSTRPVQPLSSGKTTSAVSSSSVHPSSAAIPANAPQPSSAHPPVSTSSVQPVSLAKGSPVVSSSVESHPSSSVPANAPRPSSARPPVSTSSAQPVSLAKSSVESHAASSVPTSAPRPSSAHLPASTNSAPSGSLAKSAPAVRPSSLLVESHSSSPIPSTASAHPLASASSVQSPSPAKNAHVLRPIPISGESRSSSSSPIPKTAPRPVAAHPSPSTSSVQPPLAARNIPVVTPSPVLVQSHSNSPIPASAPRPVSTHPPASTSSVQPPLPAKNAPVVRPSSAYFESQSRSTLATAAPRPASAYPSTAASSKQPIAPTSASSHRQPVKNTKPQPSPPSASKPTSAVRREPPKVNPNPKTVKALSLAISPTPPSSSSPSTTPALKKQPVTPAPKHAEDLSLLSAPQVSKRKSPSPTPLPPPPTFLKQLCELDPSDALPALDASAWPLQDCSSLLCSYRCSLLPLSFSQIESLSLPSFAVKNDITDAHSTGIGEDSVLPLAPSTEADIDMEMDVLDIEDGVSSALEMVPRVSQHRLELPPPAVLPSDEYKSPVLSMRAYRLSQTFSTEWALDIRSPTVSNRIDPNGVLCRFELHGSCNDNECKWEHARSYLMQDADVVADLAAYTNTSISAPKSVPEDKSQLAAFLEKVRSTTSDKDRETTTAKLAVWRRQHSPSKDTIQSLGDDSGKREESVRREKSARVPRYFDAVVDALALEERIKANPKDVEAWLSLAVACYRNEAFLPEPDTSADSSALSALARAIECNSQSVPVWSLYLRLFGKAESEEEVRTMCEHAVRFNPWSYTIWTQYSMMEPDLEKRLNIVTRAVESICSPSSATNKGESLSGCVLDLVLRFLYALCVAGRGDEAVSHISHLCKPSAEDVSVPVWLTAALKALAPREVSLLWLLYAHVVATLSIPEVVVDRLGTRQVPFESNWRLIVNRASEDDGLAGDGRFQNWRSNLSRIFEEGVGACSKLAEQLNDGKASQPAQNVKSIWLPILLNYIAFSWAVSKGDLDHARFLCQTSLRQHTNTLELWHLYARLEEEQDNHSNAELIYKWGLKSYGGVPYMWWCTASMQLMHRNVNEALLLLANCAQQLASLPHFTNVEETRAAKGTYRQLLGLQLTGPMSSQDSKTDSSISRSAKVVTGDVFLWLCYDLFIVLTEASSVERSQCLYLALSASLSLLERRLIWRMHLQAEALRGTGAGALGKLVDVCFASNSTDETMGTQNFLGDWSSCLGAPILDRFDLAPPLNALKEWGCQHDALRVLLASTSSTECHLDILEKALQTVKSGSTVIRYGLLLLKCGRVDIARDVLLDGFETLKENFSEHSWNCWRRYVFPRPTLSLWHTLHFCIVT